jgi:hypothetical protein
VSTVREAVDQHLLRLAVCYGLQRRLEVLTHQLIAELESPLLTLGEIRFLRQTCG